MKNQLLSLSYGILIAGALFFTGCSKDDTTNPILTLSGSDAITYSLPASAGGGGTFTDPGYTASDDKDGTITSKVTVSGTVDLNRKGVYTLTYTVSDEAGNSASATRTITVVNDAEVFAGAYNNSTDTCSLTPLSAFNATVTTSDTVNNLVKINNFGALGILVNIWATIPSTTTGSLISITVPQALTSPASLDLIYQPETIVLSGIAPTSFQVHYRWNDGAVPTPASDVCTSTYIR